MSLDKLDFIGTTVEEAVERGLSIFNRTREHVNIEILDHGSKGIFGIGAKPAKVRMSLKDGSKLFDDPEEEEFEAPKPAPVKKVEPKAEAKAEAKAEPKPAKGSAKAAPKPIMIDEPLLVTQPEVKVSGDDADDDEVQTYPESIVNENSLAIAMNVVKDLLDHMRVQATVEGRIGVQDIGSNQPCLLIDVKGDDLSYLIGRQSETLNAFQYITSLIVGRENGHWVPLQIDIQGYRARRERQLRQMAVRMADQVSKSGRKISLEPMPGTERRIIHMILRDRTDVYTESTGEEPNRKVVILPRAAAK